MSNEKILAVIDALPTAFGVITILTASIRAPFSSGYAMMISATLTLLFGATSLARSRKSREPTTLRFLNIGWVAASLLLIAWSSYIALAYNPPTSF